jgi:nickel superoxide dismutase
MPCGIYDDPARIAQIREDAATIDKAIRNINKLAGSHSGTDFNQAVRWITTKEHHATNIIEVVSEYFLTQKVKPVEQGGDGYEAYLRKLADHHAVMVAAMKTKQAADPDTVDVLNKAIDKLATHYGP